MSKQGPGDLGDQASACACPVTQISGSHQEGASFVQFANWRWAALLLAMAPDALLWPAPPGPFVAGAACVPAKKDSTLSYAFKATAVFRLGSSPCYAPAGSPAPPL